MEDEKDGKNIEMQDLVNGRKKVNVEDIIREKNIQKEQNLQKEAHKAVSAFGTSHGVVDAVYNGLISMLEATSKVLNRAGSSIPIAGFVFQLLGTVVGAIGAVLDPKASTGAKIAALVIAAITITLMATAFATAGTVAAIGIGFAALGIGVIAEGAKLYGSIKHYLSLRKEKNIQKDVSEIIELELEKKNNPQMEESKLAKINERIKKLANRVGKEKLLEKLKIMQVEANSSQPTVDEAKKNIIDIRVKYLEGKITQDLTQLRTEREKINNSIIQNSRDGKMANIKDIKKLYDLDKKIEKVEKSFEGPKELQRLYQERKEIVDRYVTDMKVLESQADSRNIDSKPVKMMMDDINTVAKNHRKVIVEIDSQIEEIAKPPGYLQGQISLAKKAIVDSGTGFIAAVGGLVGTVLATVGFPPAGAAITAGVGVIGMGKAVVGTVIEHQDKKAEKELKQQKKSEVREEIVEEYRKQSSYSQLATAGIMSTKAPESAVTPVPSPAPPRPSASPVSKKPTASAPLPDRSEPSTAPTLRR